MIKYIKYEDALNDNIFDNNDDRVVFMLPAHNEQYSIGNTLKSIIYQVELPGITKDVFIALDNCTDNTQKVIESYKDNLNIYLFITVNNTQRKAGALNQLYQLFYGDRRSPEKFRDSYIDKVKHIKAFIGVDADIYLGESSLSILFNELYKKYKIGAVSANYQCLMPEKVSSIPRNYPNRESLLKHGKFSGWFGRFITFCQNMEFSDWTIKQKYNHHTAEINGGQCTIFKPEALEEIFNTNKLNGIYNNDTDTEDLALTQDMRSLGWDCEISDTARCFVDSMTTYNTYIVQRTKWVSGTLDYMLKAGLSTRYSRTLWLKEVGLLLNLFIRVLLVVLIPSSILLHQFQWNWIWILPILLASVINLTIAIKTPNHRFIDLLLAFLNVSPEIYLWITLRVHIGVWARLFKVDKSDTWADQEKAEKGLNSFNWLPLIAILFIVLVISGLVYFKLITLESALLVIRPYINRGFDVLTDLTLLMLVIMIFKLFRFRGGFKA